MQYTESEIRQILEKHGKWLRGDKEGQKADLSYADLRSANLRYANLSYANLSSADLRSADLRYADLSYADLSSANLRSADLRYANLSSADLRSADLRSANLRYPNLSSADLRSADLRSANLRYPNLSYANLRSANLRYANLSYANLLKTLFEGINWLSYIGIVPDSKGSARAYKVTDFKGKGVYNGGINYAHSKTFTAELDKDVTQQCASGVNLATFAWCLNEKQDGRRLFLMSFKVTPDNICVPIGSDGKFRVGRATKIGECDWQGNLLKE